jgi:hypothetical protein
MTTGAIARAAGSLEFLPTFNGLLAVALPVFTDRGANAALNTALSSTVHVAVTSLPRWSYYGWMIGG